LTSVVQSEAYITTYYYSLPQAYTGHFFLGGEPYLPEIFFDSARKNCYANLQNYFARLISPSKY